MKLREIIEKLDKSIYNGQYIELEGFANEMGILADKFKESTRLKGYYVMKWLCTDTWVGAIAIFLDDVFVGYTYQPGRKCGTKYFFLDKKSYDNVRQHVIDCIIHDEIDYPETYVDLDEEMGNGYSVEYNDELLSNTFTYIPSGASATLSKNKVTKDEANEFGEYIHQLSKVVFENSTEMVVLTKDLEIAYPIKNDI